MYIHCINYAIHILFSYPLYKRTPDMPFIHSIYYLNTYGQEFQKHRKSFKASNSGVVKLQKYPYSKKTNEIMC